MNNLMNIGQAQVRANKSLKKSDYNKRYQERTKMNDFLYHLDELLAPNSEGIYKDFIDTNTANIVDSYINHFKQECDKHDMDIYMYLAHYDVTLTEIQNKALLLLMDIDVVEFGAKIFKFQIENNQSELNRLKFYIYSQLGKYKLDHPTKESLTDSIFQDFVLMLYKDNSFFTQLQMYAYLSKLVLRHVTDFRKRQSEYVDDLISDMDIYLNSMNVDVSINSYANQEQEYYITEYLNKFEEQLKANGIESMFDFLNMFNEIEDSEQKLYLVEGAKAILDYKANLSESDMKIVKRFIANSCRI